MSVKPVATIKGVVLDYLARNQPKCVSEAEFNAIRREVIATLKRQRPPSDSYLMDILLTTEVDIDRSLGGIPVDLRNKVHTASYEQAKASLLVMAEEYADAADAVRAEDVRRTVRRAKDRVRLLLRGGLSPEKRQAKQEILEWMLVWLENPLVLESWIEIRTRSMRDYRDDSVSRPAR
jgi:hypothetical protein